MIWDSQLHPHQAYNQTNSIWQNWRMGQRLKEDDMQLIKQVNYRNPKPKNNKLLTAIYLQILPNRVQTHWGNLPLESTSSARNQTGRNISTIWRETAWRYPPGTPCTCCLHYMQATEHFSPNQHRRALSTQPIRTSSPSLQLLRWPFFQIQPDRW